MSDHALPNLLLNNSSGDYLLRLPTDFYKTAKLYLSIKEIKKIQKAYSVAYYAHENQKRRDGSKYISHPVEVARILLDLKMDSDTICSASVSYTHLRAHETREDLVCRLLLEKKKCV